MSYLDRTLAPGETILATRRLHWVIYLGPAIHIALAAAVTIWGALYQPSSPSIRMVFYIAAAILLALGLITLTQQLLLGWSTEYAVTDHRLLVKRGLFSVHTVEMNLDKVESVDVDQSIIGRMLGYGSVTVHGVGSRWDPISMIPDPLAFRNAVSATARKTA